MVGAVLGANGAELGLRKPLGDPSLWPLYEEAERLDVPSRCTARPRRALASTSSTASPRRTRSSTRSRRSSSSPAW